MVKHWAFDGSRIKHVPTQSVALSGEFGFPAVIIKSVISIWLYSLSAKQSDVLDDLSYEHRESFVRMTMFRSFSQN